MKIGIFTGTFDPFTIGHQNIAERALPMFDKLVIAVAMSKLKHATEEISQRVESIKKVFPQECTELIDEQDASKGYRMEVVAYDDLTIDLAHRMGAQFLVRGVRSVKDFEYEREQADINRQLGGVETILLFSDPRYSSISSTLVRELRFFGRNVDEFLPKKRRVKNEE
nr:pantetheine-phosphate adenylyltransferase [Prevotella sp.]